MSRRESILAVAIGSILVSLPAGYPILNFVGLGISTLLFLLTLRTKVFLAQELLGIAVLRFFFDVVHIKSWNPLALPVVVFIVIALARRDLRLWLKSILTKNHFSYLAVAFSLLTILFSALALVIWVKITQPNLTEKLQFIPNYPLPILICLGFAFSLVNAVIEEILFRGIIWHLLVQQQIALPLVVLIQAMLFGILHYTGFPSGLFGIVLAGCYAIVLGFLRILTKGLLVPIVTHIFADIAIFIILLRLFRMNAYSI